MSDLLEVVGPQDTKIAEHTSSKTASVWDIPVLVRSMVPGNLRCCGASPALKTLTAREAQIESSARIPLLKSAQKVKGTDERNENQGTRSDKEEVEDDAYIAAAIGHA
ncbi:hypothetical protein CISG_02419 [Coccidioides immitis RMSCC 3703]|uniref:Uncharacterized protein n=2 Tax=Coccidioides immitis TaxID=5501 RepID=A0A0J8R7Q4_COCIT|nr:hypothetical protein CIRG_09294 [Coccidioides immitis RMSCC 2394]KMU81039.1 hypothetical protein CISG_02419 [Coccidioides immitis RMSCC 3703]